MDFDAIVESSGNIFTTSFSDLDITFTYRNLTQKEYKIFRGLRDSNIMSEWSLLDRVFERCYLGNPNLIKDDIPFGLTLTIGCLIMYLSGDCDNETLKEDIIAARTIHPPNTVHEYMRAAVISAFPGYTLEDIDGWTRSDFIRKFVIAENVLIKQNPEYKALDLSEIKTQEQLLAEETRKINKPIDFNRQNAQIRAAMGHWKNEEADDLSRKNARGLDNRS